MRLQDKRHGLAEDHVAVEVPSFGVYGRDAIYVMKQCHTAVEMVKIVETAVSWQLSLSKEIADRLDPRYRVAAPVELARELRDIELFSEKLCVTRGIVK